jgi:8-oxo-dGTP diphosphatase
MSAAQGTHLPPLLVVAAALTRADGCVLVQQRPAGKQHAGLWEFPGGKVEAGERPEIALIRELIEELGITAPGDALTPLAFSTEAGAGRLLVLLLYRVRRWSGEPRAMEAPAIRWVSPAELAGLSMPPADVPLVAALTRDGSADLRW